MRYLFVLALFGLFSCSKAPDLPVVEKVDLERYQGRWYEIATFPIRPQKDCKCTFAEYTLAGDEVKVYNKCINKNNGEVIDINGKATAEKGSNNARLKVSFFPLINAPYYIIALDKENYQYAMVGSPNRKYLWILSRDTQLDPKVRKMLVDRAEELGFPVEELVETIHDC